MPLYYDDGTAGEEDLPACAWCDSCHVFYRVPYVLDADAFVGIADPHGADACDRSSDSSGASRPVWSPAPARPTAKASVDA